MVTKMDKPKSRRGFAAMSPEKQKAIAQMGGSYKGRKGFATMDPEQQRVIARKGGMSSHGGGRRKLAE
jgi:general stress protein YciG